MMDKKGDETYIIEDSHLEEEDLFEELENEY